MRANGSLGAFLFVHFLWVSKENVLWGAGAEKPRLYISKNNPKELARPSGLEPEPPASEASTLSIELRAHLKNIY